MPGVDQEMWKETRVATSLLSENDLLSKARQEGFTGQAVLHFSQGKVCLVVLRRKVGKTDTVHIEYAI